MSHLKRALSIVLCILALPATLALAQDACPATATCTDYHGTVIEVDPAQGPRQFVVVEEQSLTTTNFDGETTTHRVKVIELASNGDVFVVKDEFVTNATGVFAEADLGDIYVLQEVQQ